MRRFIIISLIVALGLGSGLVAQEPLSLRGREIVGIEYRGLRALAEESVDYYLGIEAGSPFDPDALDEAIRTLWSRELIDDIQVEAVPEGEGVRLVVTLQERRTLRSLDYEGLKKVSRSDIRERAERDGLFVQEGGPLDLGDLERLKAVIEELYAEKGYRFAEVKMVQEEVEPGIDRVAVTVDEGDKVKIDDIRFEGAEIFGERRLRWAMKKTKETGLITRMFKKDIYSPATLEEDLDEVRKLYREAGYKNVVIDDPELGVVAKRPNAPTPKEQKRRLQITIPVDEGLRWKFGEVSIEGNEVYSDESLLRFFERPRGGWLRTSVVDDGTEGIGDLYKNSGYIYAQVVPELVEREDQIADVVIHVDEGEQFRVGRLEFEGNTRTRDKVLRREFRVQEGRVVNMGGLKNSLYKVKQLGYFDLNEDEPILFDVDNEEKTVDLTVQGEEADRMELQFGGGWSEFDGFFAQFSFRTRNFLGRGETLGMSLQTGRYRNMFDVSYYIPWFLDRPQSLGAQVFRRDEDFNLLVGQEYKRESRGGVLTYGRSFGLFQSFAISYTNSQLTDSRQLLNLDGEIVQQNYEISNSSLRPSYTYDSRDSLFEPTRGTRLLGSVEYAGGFLGGTNYFWRPELRWSMFVPIGRGRLKTVFGVNLGVGLVKPFSGRVLSPLEQYYLGGERSVRGFRTRSIWVRDKDGHSVLDEYGFPAGGDKFAQLNLEYQFLLGGPFRLVAFFDAGAVYGEGQGIGDSPERLSAGLELRMLVPMFGAPLRFIYSKNLDPLPDDRFEDFQFSIGTSF